MRSQVVHATGCFLLVMQLVAAASTNSSAMNNKLTSLKIVEEQYCSHTRFPRLCAKTLLHHHSTYTTHHHHHLLSTLLNKTIHETNLPTSYFSPLPSNVHDGPHVSAIGTCVCVYIYICTTPPWKINKKIQSYFLLLILKRKYHYFFKKKNILTLFLTILPLLIFIFPKKSHFDLFNIFISIRSTLQYSSI